MDTGFIFGLIILVIAVIVFVVTQRPTPKDKYKQVQKPRLDQKVFYAQQTERVATGGYSAQKLLNKTEQIAHKAIWRAIAQQDDKYYLFAQVSLGEVLSHQNDDLYRDINSKRIDFIIADKNYYPVAAIEVHGQGHYKNIEIATARDQIKRNAIESAGIGYIAVAVGDDWQQTNSTVFDKVNEFFKETGELNDNNGK